MYDIILALIGLGFLGAAWLPRVIEAWPLSYPIVYIGFGLVAFSLPIGLEAPDPMVYPRWTERIAEFAVILALMGAGLKIDRPFRWRTWGSTWRLLAITMPLTIGAMALLGWGLLGLTVPAAILLGAVLAPTDPVLASDVQVGPPQTGGEDEVRFALTSEAGLNDGLAFPYTYLAVTLATAGLAPEAWLADWVLVDVLYRIVVGCLVGWALGYVLMHFVFRGARERRLAETGEGFVVLSMTLVVYGLTEIVHAYGFLAVFVAGLAIRYYERHHRYHDHLHMFAEQVERLLIVVLLVLLGGAIADGLLAPLTWPAVVVGLAFLFVIRPRAGMIGLWGSTLTRPERELISFLGIRGVGSFYYLAFALNEVEFVHSSLLWAMAGFVVLVSVVVHGIFATPLMTYFDRYAEKSVSLEEVEEKEEDEEALP